MQYQTHVDLETPNLVEAIRFAAAVAMHTGKSTQLYRMSHDETTREVTKSNLLALNPAQYDYRAVAPAMAIAMKAMAHELVTNIDEVVPEVKKEGFAA
jgi:hypothetical protein